MTSINAFSLATKPTQVSSEASMLNNECNRCFQVKINLYVKMYSWLNMAGKLCARLICSHAPTSGLSNRAAALNEVSLDAGGHWCRFNWRWRGLENGTGAYLAGTHRLKVCSWRNHLSDQYLTACSNPMSLLKSYFVIMAWERLAEMCICFAFL